MPWRLILSLSTVGIVMGLITTFVGIERWMEPGAWLAIYVAWSIALINRRLPNVMMVFTAVSVIGAFFTGCIQFLFHEEYALNNPHYVERVMGDSLQLAGAFIGDSILFGLVFGLIVGSAVRSKQSKLLAD